MGAQQTKGLVVCMRRKGGARCARFLAPHLLAVASVNLIRFAPQRCNLLLGKAFGKKQIAAFVKFLQLLRCELHDGPPFCPASCLAYLPSATAAMTNDTLLRFDLPAVQVADPVDSATCGSDLRKSSNYRPMG